MDSRIFIAVFTAFLTYLVPVVFSVHYLSTSPDAENGQLEFSVLLYKDGNFAVSTIDVFLHLLRLYYGSQPPTRPILATVLGVSRTVSPETAYRVLLRKIEGTRSGKSHFRELLVLPDWFEFKRSYDATALHFRWSGLKVVLLEKDDFVGMIRFLQKERSLSTIYTPDDLSGVNPMVFLGGGHWNEDVPLENESPWRCTYRGVFYLNASLSVADVKYTSMFVNVTHGELPDIEASYIELNWAKKPSNVSTYIIFPNEQTDLNLVEKNIRGRTIRTMIDNTHRGFIQLSLPEVNFESKLFLKDILQKMKVSNVFSGETNFSELADPPPEQIDEVVNAVTFRAFAVNGTVPECTGGREPILRQRAPFTNFKMNRGAIIVLVHKGDPTHEINPVVLGMARYQHPTP